MTFNQFIRLYNFTLIFATTTEEYRKILEDYIPDPVFINKSVLSIKGYTLSAFYTGTDRPKGFLFAYVNRYAFSNSKPSDLIATSLQLATAIYKERISSEDIQCMMLGTLQQEIYEAIISHLFPVAPVPSASAMGSQAPVTAASAAGQPTPVPAASPAGQPASVTSGASAGQSIEQ